MMRICMVVALLAATIGATNCSSQSEDVGESSPTTAISRTTITVDESAELVDDSAVDPSHKYFDLDHVMDISIEIPVADWDTLRHQTRTLEDVFAEASEYNLSRPFAKIYTWFKANVSVDGVTLRDVGIRKKGFVGSQSDTKPSIKLRFDRYEDNQALGGVMERMTLNNNVQDPSMINTCMAYRVFAAVGYPAPRCSFATVTLNGNKLGLYTHVEEIKAPFLERHFESSDGNVYEGNVSDFDAEFRGTFEKKTHEDVDDWSDIDAVVSALADRSPAGLRALADAVDLELFLTFWATEVLIGHWDGYAGNHNNYWFYREPGGRFVFLPWGTDSTFLLEDDPNPFDRISDPPPSVLALGAISNRLYHHPDWRDAYVARLKSILDTAWDPDELLLAADKMAAIVQQHALPDAAAIAAADTERVRTFIRNRQADILADLTPQPPDWPQQQAVAGLPAESGSLDFSFETTWQSDVSPNPWMEGTITDLRLNGFPEPIEAMGIIAGYADAQERTLLTGFEKPVSIAAIGVNEDNSLSGMTLVLDLKRFASGATLVIGSDAIAGGVWHIPPGASNPDTFVPFTEGTLRLSIAEPTTGATIVGTYSGVYGYAPPQQ